MARKDDDLAFDLSSIKKFFRKDSLKGDLGRWGLIALLIIAMGIVFYIRMLPASLPVTEDWADASLRQGVRNQFQAQVQQEFPNLPQANRDQLVSQRTAAFLEQQGGQFDQQKQLLSDSIRQNLQYEGDDGEQYTYLGDLDSYFWLRYTRNWLETGTICDIITPEGQCRDMYVLAPVGQPQENPSSHIFAIGYLHKIITLFNPDHPLPATSFLVPVLAGLLGIIPAFFIGRRLAGNVGGFFAAILISLHPLLLSRSMGSDNDVWNIVIPLFVMWMAVEALHADKDWTRAVFAGISGLLIGIFATFWAAWWFIYLIMFFGLLGSLIYMIARHAIRERTAKVWEDTAVRGMAIVFVTFYIVAMIVLVAVGTRTVGTYLQQPLVVTSAGANLDRAIGDNYWPNVLTTVAELNKSNFNQAVNQMGGKTMFFGCLIGLLLMILPRSYKKWGWEQYTILGGGAIISLYLLNSDLGFFASTLGPRLGTIALLALPIGIIIILDLVRDYKVDVTIAMIVLVWFLASIYATYSGIRFILLLIPAFGIGFAVTAGRAYTWISEYVLGEFKINKAIVYVLVFLILSLVLVNPVRSGHTTAKSFVPTINDAWWETLTKIRQESSPDAVINSWWDFGHWFKYVADRRVSADGTTQNTHVPRWLGLALVTPDERQSIGILRMLNCGSDAYPTPEGDFGAYGRILSRTEDPIRSQEMVIDLTQLDREEAETYLEDDGFDSSAREDILNATHCEPVEDYFITSGDMVGKAGVWSHFGLWDFDRSFIAHVSRTMTQAEAVNAMVEQLDISQEEASRAYFEVRALQSEAAVNQYVSPWPGYITGSWRPCGIGINDTVYSCSLGIGLGQQGATQQVIDGFVYNTTSGNGSLVLGAYQNGVQLQQVGQAPDRFLIADEDSLREVDVGDAAGSNVAVLLDTVNNRILVSDPRLIDSTFTQLFYLNGRYSEYYDLFHDRTTFNGLRILTWKVDWDGDA